MSVYSQVGRFTNPFVVRLCVLIPHFTVVFVRYKMCLVAQFGNCVFRVFFSFISVLFPRQAFLRQQNCHFPIGCQSAILLFTCALTVIYKAQLPVLGLFLARSVSLFIFACKASFILVFLIARSSISRLSIVLISTFSQNSA